MEKAKLCGEKENKVGINVVFECLLEWEFFKLKESFM